MHNARTTGPGMHPRLHVSSFKTYVFKLKSLHNLELRQQLEIKFSTIYFRRPLLNSKCLMTLGLRLRVSIVRFRPTLAKLVFTPDS